MATITQPAEARPFEHLVLDFLAYLEFERGLSRNTLEAYRSDLLQFGRFIDARGTTAVAASSADLGDFLADLDGYAGSGLPGRTMGRSIAEDDLFFRAALAGGDVLAAEA